jgi:hypothetical protein
MKNPMDYKPGPIGMGAVPTHEPNRQQDESLIGREWRGENRLTYAEPSRVALDAIGYVCVLAVAFFIWVAVA